MEKVKKKLLLRKVPQSVKVWKDCEKEYFKERKTWENFKINSWMSLIFSNALLQYIPKVVIKGAIQNNKKGKTLYKYTLYKYTLYKYTLYKYTLK